MGWMEGWCLELREHGVEVIDDEDDDGDEDGEEDGEDDGEDGDGDVVDDDCCKEGAVRVTAVRRTERGGRMRMRTVRTMVWSRRMVQKNGALGRSKMIVG